MGSSVGRNLSIKKGSAVIAGIRSKTIAVAGEPIDITSDDDGGYRTLLDCAGTMSLDISFDGVTKDAVLRGIILNPSSGVLELTDITIEYPNGDTITGNFFFNSLEETGATADAINFSGSMQSSGAWVYTAA